MAISSSGEAAPGGYGGHVVYVNVSNGQRQTVTRQRRRAVLLAGCVVGAMCACLAVGGFMEERSYGVYRPPTIELTEHVVNQQDVSDLESTMADEQMKATLVAQASKNLPTPVKELAASLADSARTTTLDNCAQKAALELQIFEDRPNKIRVAGRIKTNFGALLTKMEAENATLHTKDAGLAVSAAAKKKLWMDSESTYRLAEGKVTTATAASTYSSSQYSKYSTAVLEGQKSWDALKPKYDQEKAQLQSELPVLLQLKALIATLMSKPAEAAAAAADSATTLHQIQVASKVDALKQQLVAKSNSDVTAGAHAIVDKLMAEMSLRIAELEKMTGELETEMSENKAALATAEQSLVTLGEQLDRAKNSLNTADLSRKTLGGQYEVAQEEYEDNHASFLDDSARISRELRAIGMILDKVDAAIAKCAGTTTSSSSSEAAR